MYWKCQRSSRVPTMKECELILKEYIASYPRTTIILDALDECDEFERHELVIIFDNMISTSTKPVKIFISSRPDVDIKNRFINKSNIRIQATNNRSDITRYIITEMQKHASWRAFSSSLQKQIITTLDEGAKGM